MPAPSWAALLLLLTGVALAQPPAIPLFSALPAGGEIRGWRPLKPAPLAPDTRYTLEDDGGLVVVRAEAVAAMSGLVHTLRVPAAQLGTLQWRWRIRAPVASADLREKSGDDYAARVYVLFDYPRARLSWTTRAKLALAEALYGQPLPTAALNYVWDNLQPVGTVRPNAYTDRARLIVLESGAARAGEWVTETRDLAADFRAAFGEAPPDLSGIAIATDTDNTGEHATAWFGDLVLH
ncbi:MAG: DUF3047 domain-containing protein [Gammaproteobacteria bacterium]|nr:DUF3047 domain-containing protein [Gammaproteobacteria bacterium]